MTHSPVAGVVINCFIFFSITELDTLLFLFMVLLHNMSKDYFLPYFLVEEPITLDFLIIRGIEPSVNSLFALFFMTTCLKAY